MLVSQRAGLPERPLRSRQAARVAHGVHLRSITIPQRPARRLTGLLHVATREAEAALPDLDQHSTLPNLHLHPDHTTAAEAVAQELGTDVISTDVINSTSACPFLAALPSPPRAQHQWWQRPLQLLNPPAFQPAAMGGHRVVEAGAELGLPNSVFVGDGDLARTVLGGEGDITLQGTFLKGFATLIGSQSLLAVQEPHHKYMRALIMPAFDKPVIERLVPRMEAVITKYLHRWSCQPSVKASDENKTMTFDFIINVIMGRDFSEEELASLIDLYKVWSSGLLAWPYIALPFTRYGKALKARQDLITRLQVDVDAARQQLAAAGTPPPGVLGSLVAAVDEEGNRLTDQQVLENLLLLLLAGHDTSAVTLTHILAELHRHPWVMTRLREEQQVVVGRHGATLTGAVLRDMEETLRRNPVVPSLARVAARDFELGGYSIKKGQFVVPLLTLTASLDPRWQQDEPDQFKPERMMTHEGQKRGWQMPFGYGPRFCAGYAVAMAEMKAFLALLARGYEFTADVNTQWVQSIGRVPVNGLPITVKRLP